jgi:hypothetical protein
VRYGSLGYCLQSVQQQIGATMMILKTLTYMHLATARKMPRKESQLWLGEKADKKYKRQAKGERKLIAKYYLAVRNSIDPGYGRKTASIAHRYGAVTTGKEAKARLLNMGH